MCFLGLDRDPHISDAKTIWLFRETLAQMVVVAILFERIEAKMAICEGENTGTADEADNSMGWSIPSS